MNCVFLNKGLDILPHPSLFPSPFPVSDLLLSCIFLFCLPRIFFFSILFFFAAPPRPSPLRIFSSLFSLFSQSFLFLLKLQSESVWQLFYCVVIRDRLSAIAQFHSPARTSNSNLT
ncbi:uncharacterized protein ASPGLDRAFT_542432 [Aspergillus glaucus CBS 516.65]|uniref:Transmembrane protein n=1 Tax=Aspergillus glaucus CBS 516.65 TaxID=1160497 RepID=A0A1L9VET2_ASPGL|nr:hypothetical protein ASPGLDRAFT_542432 [Aspergillus glaucus CBS 516.65]OJJ82437.1 hypothetical protein ASPGLDRAFT_542432 [Aspergillus glaucus CBS 516.65]